MLNQQAQETKLFYFKMKAAIQLNLKNVYVNILLQQ